MQLILNFNGMTCNKIVSEDPELYMNVVMAWIAVLDMELYYRCSLRLQCKVKFTLASLVTYCRFLTMSKVVLYTMYDSPNSSLVRVIRVKNIVLRLRTDSFSEYNESHMA